MMVEYPRNGELRIADIPSDKRRPVLILTRTTFIPRLVNVTMAPVVSRVRGIPTEIVVDTIHGIDHRSAVSFDNVLTIPHHNLIERVGFLSNIEMTKACQAIALALGCS
jgi:mRNA interferase MazF